MRNKKRFKGILRNEDESLLPLSLSLLLIEGVLRVLLFTQAKKEGFISIITELPIKRGDGLIFHRSDVCICSIIAWLLIALRAGEGTKKQNVCGAEKGVVSVIFWG
jgi:hypothetical protein